MPDAFVPFTPAARPAGAAPGFQPKRATASAPAAAPAFSALAASLGGSACATGQPTVTLRREGERVTGLQVQCTCGQVIELTFSF